MFDNKDHWAKNATPTNVKTEPINRTKSTCFTPQISDMKIRKTKDKIKFMIFFIIIPREL